ncbi:MAG: TetR/AcrR family transcriptional regulator [Pseudomonadota bacterium]|nr:TetR/AcrR family transcriptional regulator [Pseudomonadota bacterium]
MNKSLNKITTGKRETNKENNRLKIIESGIEIFSKKGISETTVRDIIRNTGLASGTFYNYFKTKEEVLIAAIDDAAYDLAKILEKGRRKASNIEEFIEFQVDPFFEMVSELPELFVIFSTNLNAVDRFTIQTPQITLAIEDLKKDLELAIKNKIIPDVDIDYFSAVFSSTIEAVAIEYVKNNKKTDLEFAKDFCVNFLVKSLRN